MTFCLKRKINNFTFFVSECYKNRENIDKIHICFAQSFDNKFINTFIDHNFILNSILKLKMKFSSNFVLFSYTKYLTFISTKVMHHFQSFR